jgi:hypothetical protein
MKAKLISMLLLMSVILSCRKDQQSITTSPTVKTSDSVKSLSLADVKDWYGKNISNSGSQKNLNAVVTTNGTKNFSLSSMPFTWDKIQSVTNQKGNYWLVYLNGQPTFQNVKQGYRKLAFIRDSTGQIQPRILEIIPDGLYYQLKQKVTKADFTGRIFIYDQQYNLLGGQVFSAGKQIGRIKPKSQNSGVANTSANSGTSTKTATISMARIYKVNIDQDCEWYDNNYIDGNGEVAIYSELDCTYSVYDDGSGNGGGDGDYSGSTDDSGGGGGDATSAPAMSNLPLQNSPAIDPKAFMICFGSLPDIGSAESVTVYVQEPSPGTSFNVGPNSVGHVAIGLTKSYNGTTITQVVGFYPNATGARKFSAPSKVSDNGGDLAYDVSVTYNVIPQEFNQIINYISNPPATYNVMSFNCTNFVYNACQAGGITLPNPNTSLIFGAATVMTPGALGSNIDDLSGMSGINNNGGTTPNSKGACN